MYQHGEKNMEFKKGDKVKFKHPHSDNARFFKHGLTNLTIMSTDDSSSSVRESVGNRKWSVMNKEITLMTNTWRKKI